jgi:hypothetical protein
MLRPQCAQRLTHFELRTGGFAWRSRLSAHCCAWSYKADWPTDRAEAAFSSNAATTNCDVASIGFRRGCLHIHRMIAQCDHTCDTIPHLENDCAHCMVAPCAIISRGRSHPSQPCAIISRGRSTANKKPYMRLLRTAVRKRPHHIEFMNAKTRDATQMQQLQRTESVI